MNTLNKDRPTPARFAVGVDNAGNEASLEIGKLYDVFPDDAASSFVITPIWDVSKPCAL